MKCKECSEPVEVSRGNYDYSISGLPVTLVDVEIRTCSACGARTAAIPRIEELHRSIANAVTQKASRLTGAEVRYLRKFLGWSGADFARHIGASPESVSRWENDKEPIGGTNDRLLRLLVANVEPVSHYPVESLENISPEAKAVRVRAKPRASGWTAEAGA